jgi:1,2-diacylglycerol 3-beta-glucosyltransferase
MFFFCGLYLGFALLLLLSYYAAPQPEGRKVWEPTVCIIVAARNEARALPACLQSLIDLDYPHDKLEILIVNDHSQDHTGHIIESCAAGKEFIRHIDLLPGEKAMPGKAGAVLAGIEKSRGEIIFLTDADCQVPATWIRVLLKEFTPETGLVGGFTLLHSRHHPETLLGRIQSLDWLFLLTIATISARLGKPLSWMGNNMAFRRSAYEEIGGYRSLGDSLIEDFVLIHALAQKTSWRISFQCHPDSTIHSQPVSSLQSLYQQRKRWGLGIRIVRPFGKALMVSSFIAHLSVLAGFLLNLRLGVLGLAAMMGVDLLICWCGAWRLNRLDLLRQFIGFEVFYFIYSVFLPPALLLSSRVAWKNQVYTTRPRPSGRSNR